MRGEGETPPLFKLMIPRVTLNDCWISDQKSSSDAACSGERSSTLFAEVSISLRSAPTHAYEIAAKPNPLPAEERKSLRDFHPGLAMVLYLIQRSFPLKIPMNLAMNRANVNLISSSRDLKVAPTDASASVAAAFRLRSFSRDGTAPRSKTRKLKLAATYTPAAERPKNAFPRRAWERVRIWSSRLVCSDRSHPPIVILSAAKDLRTPGIRSARSFGRSASSG